MELPGLSIKKQLDGFVDGIKDQIGGVVIVVAALWGLFLLDVVAYWIGFDFRDWFSLRPRTFSGLPGIFTSPFVHGDVWHLIGNTWGLVVAMLALVVIRPKTWMRVLIGVYLISGTLTWMFGGMGGNSAIVGASGVVMGLVTFLVAPGVFLLGWWGYNKITKQRKPFPMDVQLVPLVVAAVAGFFYVDNLFFNLVPVPALTTGGNTSWSAHWCGAIAGLIVAFIFLKNDEIDQLRARMPDATTSAAAGR